MSTATASQYKRASYERLVHWTLAGVLAAAPGLFVTSVAAQEFPVRPVRIVLGFPPGGITDITARLLADALSKTWGRQAVVDNRAGASGIIGADHVAKSPPDGYTLLITTSAANVVAPHLYAKMPYDAEKDFSHITLLSSSPSVLMVNPKVPVKTLREFIEYSKARPGQLAYSSPGKGLTGHLAVEMFAAAAGVQYLHVPYKGSGPGLTAAIAGEVQMVYDPVASSLPHIRSGALRPLAVSTAERSSILPDVPTMAESGLKGIEFSTWTGISAPAGTPRDVIAKIFRDTVAAMRGPAIMDKLQGLQTDVVASASPDEFSAFVHNEASRWGTVIRRAGIQAE